MVTVMVGLVCVVMVMGENKRAGQITNDPTDS